MVTPMELAAYIPPVHLSTAQRTVLKLWSTGMSYQEIGEALRITTSTVKEHMKRARAAYNHAGYDIPPRRAGYVFMARNQGVS